MKKMKRWCAALTAVVLCLSLCGCAELDKMQAAHGVWVDDKTVEWNGNTYTLLEGYWTDLSINYGETVFITDPDVPVLLSQVMGEVCTVNNTGTLLSCYIDDIWLGESGERIYCRSDLVEWLEDAFINGYELETFQCEYWDDTVGEACLYTLTDEQVQAVNTVLDTVDPFAVEDYYPSDYSSVTLYGYSAYCLFMEQIGWIDQIDGCYYIFRENEHEGYGWNEDCYIVPAELNTIFASIMDGRYKDNPVANNVPTVYPPSFFT